MELRFFHELIVLCDGAPCLLWFLLCLCYRLLLALSRCSWMFALILPLATLLFLQSSACPSCNPLLSLKHHLGRRTGIAANPVLLEPSSTPSPYSASFFLALIFSKYFMYFFVCVFVVFMFQHNVSDEIKDFILFVHHHTE